MMMVSVLIVLLVIAGLIYITINKKVSAPADQIQLGQTEQNVNMQNTQNTPNVQDNTQKIEGLTITTLKEGTGDVVKTGDTVAMNYTGTLTNGTTFDSNVDPKFKHVQPFVFTIGAGQVIKGWDLGIAGMKVGEKRKLEIVPDLAYGAAGAGSVIPPNATLIFEVELLAIKK